MKIPETNRPTFSPFSIIVVFLALMIIGAAFIPLLDVRFKPSHNLPQLSVRFSWPNASPEVIEEETSKIEGVLGKINQVISIESTSSVGSGSVTLNFDKTADLNKKRYEVSALIRQLRGNLPPEMSYPEITANIEQDDQASFMVLTLNANTTTFEIKKVAEQQVISNLLKLQGIADITLHGVTPHQWEIRFDPELLKNYSLTPSEISAVVNQLGDKSFLGVQKDGAGVSLPVLTQTKNIAPEKWGNLPIANKNGRIIKLADVATVKLREKPPTSYYRINGKNTINMVVYAAPGENQVKLGNKIREQLVTIQENLPFGYRVQVASDSTLFIKEELNKIGMRTLFSLLILLLFVLVASRSFRILGVLFISLIANLLIACIFYYLFKVEIHIYSLAAVTVSFGIIIDNSIIMVSHLQRQRGLRVFVALLAATLTTLGALSVVFFLKENQKLMLIDFTWVMIINLSVSLVVSLFLVPALMDKMYKKKTRAVSSPKTRKRVIWITRFYQRFIVFEKRYKWAFIIIVILGFGLPVGMLPDEIETETAWAKFYNKTLGAEKFKSDIKPVLEKALGGSLRLFTEHVFEGSFYSDPGKTTLYARGSMPEGCTIHQLNEAVRKMEQYISLFDEVEQFETRISSYKNSSITVHFTKEAENSSFPFLLKSQMESKAISLGGMDWGIYGVGKGFSNALNMDYKNSHILLTGYNYNQVYNYAEQLQEKLLTNPRVDNTEITSSQSWYSATRYEYYLQVEKELLALQDINYSSYTGSLFTQLYSRNLQPYYNENESQPVVLVSSVYEDYNKWDFYNMPVNTPKGQNKLSQAGEINKLLTGKSIYKKDQVYQLYLNYNFIGPGPLAQMVQEREINAINEILPLGYKAQKPDSYWYWNSKEKKQYWLLLLIIVIIYFITAILFESLLKPMAVIVLIPISFIGVFLTFYLFGFNFDQGGFASFILLSGLVVNAAIYIINDFNNLTNRMNKPPSIRTYLKAFNQKIVAITLTILSTVLGLIPFVLGGQKEVFWFAFAVGAMGGLIFSMVAIILYLPLLLRLEKEV